MTDEKRSRVLGMILGSVSRGQFPQREPIGYLYGHEAKDGETPTHTINGVDYVGVVAPDIYSVWTPELQESHPYAFISPYGEGFDLFLTNKKSKGVDFDGNPHISNASLIRYCSNGHPLTWGSMVWKKENHTGWFTAGGECVWSNQDLTYQYQLDHTDIQVGTLYIAASEPVPVYE